MFRPDSSTTGTPRSHQVWRESFKIFCVVVAYWIISMSMVFINKYLLSSPDLKLEAPLFITWSQCVWTMGLCWGAGMIGKIKPEWNFFNVPHIQIDMKLAWQVLPLSIVFASMITFNNLCLKYVTVAFYNIGRSLTTVFNVVFTYSILKENTSPKALLCCASIIGGFFLGVDQEKVGGSFSLLGMFFGVCASACVALNAIYTKRTLPIVNQDIWQLQFYNNLNAVLLFLPLMIISGEIPVLMAFQNLFSLKFMGMCAVAGICGFAIGFVTGLQVKVTSALTHNISGTAKACVQTIIAVGYFHEVKTFLWWFSNFVVLLASAAYTQVRRSEMLAKQVTAVKEMPLLQVHSHGREEEEEEEELISLVREYHGSNSPTLMDDVAAQSEDSVSDVEEGYRQRI